MLFLISLILFSFSLSFSLYHFYGSLLHHKLLISLSVITSWSISILMILLLPMDVSGSLYTLCSTEKQFPFLKSNRSENSSSSTQRIVTLFQGSEMDIPSNTSSSSPLPFSFLIIFESLPVLWRLLYWSSQILTWILIPFLQSFHSSAHFTLGSKLKSSLKDYFTSLSSYLLLAFFLGLYIAFQPHLPVLTYERLKVIASSASNTWGLFVLVLCMGYGLVEVPRRLWLQSCLDLRLKVSYFHLGNLIGEKAEAEEKLEDELKILALTQKTATENTAPFVSIIVKIVPFEKYQRAEEASGSPCFERERRLYESSEETQLIALHSRVKEALDNVDKIENQWKDLTSSILFMENLLPFSQNSFKENSYNLLHHSSESSKKEPKIFSGYQYLWHLWFCPLFFKLFSGLSGFCSVLILWSEISFSLSFTSTSSLSLLASLTKCSQDVSYGFLEILSFVTLSYLACITYYTVFQIKFFNLYALSSSHRSNERSLLFSGALVSRLTPPLILNFLSMAQMDSYNGLKNGSKVRETVYTSINGHNNVFSFLSEGFNVYFPLALILLTTATYFSLGKRFLSAFGFPQFYPQNNNELSLDIISEGQEYMRREKRKRSRQSLERPRTVKTERRHLHNSNIDRNTKPPRNLFDDV